MSGQLVGEVIAASDSLRARGLSERGFHALVAIAEKASTHDRTAAVRWDHVRAGLYGASKRTAQRAVEDATKAGVIQVVKRGFRNQHGASRAPVYRISPLVDDDTQVSRSCGAVDDTQVSQSTSVDDDKSELDDDKSRVDDDTQVSYLTFPYDVSVDERVSRPVVDRHSHPPDLELDVIDAEIVDDLPADPEPRRYCRAHMPYGSGDACSGCKIARLNHEQWETRNHRSGLGALAALAADERAKEQAEARKEIRQSIDHCPDCDSSGRLDDQSDCPKHVNFRQGRSVAAS